MVSEIVIERWAQIDNPPEEKYVVWSNLKLRLDPFRPSPVLDGHTLTVLRSQLIKTVAPAGRYRLGVDDRTIFNWDGEAIMFGDSNTMVISLDTWSPASREEVLRRLPHNDKARIITVVVEPEP